jgi:hypothetical protein
MAGVQKILVRVRIQLVAVNGTNDLWVDLSRFIQTIGVTRVRGRIVLCEKSGNFRARPGIQTYTADPEVPDAALAPSTGTGLGYVSTVSKNFVDWDPAVAGNGNIGTKRGFRVGLLYSSTDATVSRGDVILELYVDA